MLHCFSALHFNYIVTIAHNRSFIILDKIIISISLKMTNINQLSTVLYNSTTLLKRTKIVTYLFLNKTVCESIMNFTILVFKIFIF